LKERAAKDGYKPIPENSEKGMSGLMYNKEEIIRKKIDNVQWEGIPVVHCKEDIKAQGPVNLMDGIKNKWQHEQGTPPFLEQVDSQ
jgi:hypothetical protein